MSLLSITFQSPITSLTSPKFIQTRTITRLSHFTRVARGECLANLIGCGMGDGSSWVSGMKLSLTLLIIVALLGPASALADMQSDIRAVLQDKLLHKATVGIQVV